MSGSKSEQRKRLFLAALGLVFLAVLLYQFVGGSPSEEPASTTTHTPSPPQKRAGTSQQPRRPATEAERDAWVQEQLADVSPLNIVKIRHAAGTADVGARGNIFAFYVPPPTPPPPPPPPPPITLQAVQPGRNLVAGSPFKVPVILLGKDFPADAQILFNGSPKATTRVSDNQLKTEMEPSEYSSPVSINVEVKSKGDPVKLYSNPMQLTIQQGPEPLFVYRGRHGTTFASIELPSSREYKLLKRGDIIEGVWRIENITEREIEVIHTQYEIKRRKAIQQAPR
jgi:hypothetical protein